MNFGETLAHWYLRFNGFFLLSNFAFHHYNERGNSADADLLAVRWPYVYEEIGGKDDDWDDEQFEKWGINIKECVTGLIVEVKTGKEFSENFFCPDRLTYAIKRFGFWRPSLVAEAAEALTSSPIYTSGNITVGKLLVAAKFPSDIRDSSYLRLDLRCAEEFILNRVEKYNDKKWAGRFFFPSDLMQYLIWSRKRRSRRRPTSHQSDNQ